MALSITDIAKAAGVSTATISRVLNHSPNLREETRQHVRAVMKELNYVPNSLARGFPNSKAFNVALLIDVEDADFANPFFYEVMHGIEAVVCRRDLSLIIASSTPSGKLETVERMIREKRMQGVFVPSSLADAGLVEKLNELSFPFVVIGEIADASAEATWVDINNRQGGNQAVAHLAGKGYRRIAFVGGSREKVFNRNRITGYLEAVARLEVQGGEYLTTECEDSKADAYSVMKELLSLDERPDAVVCGDNVISMGVIKAVHELGLTIPADFGLVSFDRYPLAELVEPSLTTVDIDVFHLGELAAESLMALLKTPHSSHVQSLVSTRIEQRESTARDLET
jgi:DNA-binding LacI/PurR family transcriptional regulator